MLEHVLAYAQQHGPFAGMLAFSQARRLPALPTHCLIAPRPTLQRCCLDSLSGLQSAAVHSACCKPAASAPYCGKSSDLLQGAMVAGLLLTLRRDKASLQVSCCCFSSYFEGYFGSASPNPDFQHPALPA